MYTVIAEVKNAPLTIQRTFTFNEYRHAREFILFCDAKGVNITLQMGRVDDLGYALNEIGKELQKVEMKII